MAEKEPEPPAVPPLPDICGSPGADKSCTLRRACRLPRVMPPEALDEEGLLALEELQVAGVTPVVVEEVWEALRESAQEEEELADKWTAWRLAVANNGDVAAALRQHRESVEWMAARRSEIGAHDVSTEHLFFRRGWDRLGHPVLVWNGEVHHAAERTPEQVAVAAAALAREAAAVVAEQGLLKYTLIIYLPRGTELDWRMGKEVATVLQRHYPERLYRALIFPCGFWTTVAWNALKHVVNSRTRNKLRFLSGTEPESFLEFIAPEQLPEVFGGTDAFRLPYALHTPCTP